MHFSDLSYDDYSNYFNGRVDVSLFVAMNATEVFYNKLYKDKFVIYAKELEMLNGEITLYPSYNTLQVKDYFKFNMGSFDESQKNYIIANIFLRT